MRQHIVAMLPGQGGCECPPVVLWWLECDGRPVSDLDARDHIVFQDDACTATGVGRGPGRLSRECHARSATHHNPH